MRGTLLRGVILALSVSAILTQSKSCTVCAKSHQPIMYCLLLQHQNQKNQAPLNLRTAHVPVWAKAKMAVMVEMAGMDSQDLGEIEGHPETQEGGHLDHLDQEEIEDRQDGQVCQEYRDFQEHQEVKDGKEIWGYQETQDH